ncbi:Hexokinase 3 [Hibiscus syriacus]|uniref:Hexokinase 3 n=1 Tax=Hibiscus syriacus TaxID=106335 RepID=A0A6A3BCZ0_HIBSY|nr:Hexokinase 3 [Hibiscus syriacus]
MALRNEVNELKRELLICKGAMSEWGALKTFLEGLRPGAMLGGEQGDAQRLSDAIAIARKLTELAGDKLSSNVSSMPMPKDSGNSGGDRENVQREMIEKALRMAKVSHRLFVTKESHRERMTRMFREASPYSHYEEDGINTANQGSRRGKAVDVEEAESRKKPETVSIQAIKIGERLGVKVVENKKGLGAIARDKIVKPRVQSEEFCSQYARIEAWYKLRHLKHKWTLKKYVSRFRKLMLKVPSLTEEDGFFTFMFELKPWAKRVLERREVNELSKALTTAESIKEFRVKKNKTSKAKPKADGSGKRFRDEGKSKDEECCSSSCRENPLNDEPDGESGEDVCSLGTSSSVKDAKPRVRVEQTRWHRLKMPEVLQNYSRGVESSKFAKASRSQVQEELYVFKEFIEHVRVQNMASNTILREGSKQGLVGDVQVRNNPSKTSGQESKGVKTLRDKATMKKLPIYKVEQDLTFNVEETKFGGDPRLFHRTRRARAKASTAVMEGRVLMRGHEQVMESKGNQVDAKYGAKDLKWESSMKDEMDSLMSNQTWELAVLPLDKKALHNKWVTGWLGTMTAELEETKHNLEKAREESMAMANCLSLLKEKLERTKRDLQKMKEREITEKLMMEFEVEDVPEFSVEKTQTCNEQGT